MTGFYDEATKGPHAVFELGDYELEGGATLPDARILYKTHGTLNERRDNAVLYPHMYGGTPSWLESTIAPGRALDPEGVVRRLPGQARGRVLVLALQHGAAGRRRRVSPRLGSATTSGGRIGFSRSSASSASRSCVGFSMGAQQAYELAVRHPDAVAPAWP